MKRWLFGIFSLLLMFAMWGCSNSKSANSQDGKTLTVWVHVSDDSEEGKVYQKRVDAFNKKYASENVEAKIDFIPRSGNGGGYEDKVNAALTTNTLPDVITLDGPNTAAYAKSGVIAPLDEYIKDQDDLLPSIKQQGTYEGKLYAIGVSESSVGIYYNKKMLKDAGVDLKTLPTVENPWTWDEFLELCKKLKNKYDKPAIDMQLQSKDEMLTYALLPFVWSAGGDVLSKDGKQAEGVFNDKPTVEAMTFIQTMLKEGYTTRTPVKQAFETEKYPMKMSGVWTVTDMETNFPNVDYGVMPYPVSPKTKKLVSPSGSWQFAMTQTSENKEWAAKLVDWMTNKESNLELSRSIAALPVRYSSEKVLAKEFSDEMNVFLQQLKETGHARPVTPAYPQVTRAFQQAIDDISFFDQHQDIHSVLDTRAKEMQSAIDKAN
ncbi:sugar ABC transporter substrate-binding protein [Bacillus paralicheniformis]|uniref:ABC transporter substrate-binding protein n=1 Tax=Bacillus TaxID=1386 RepID=UPI000951E036|nr:sugar ABC transporter substrate-binding protein [Bacillus paralicheniformis]MSN98455.1 extracellular solute-binding protein [Bacillus paralicheniformis]MSO02463.1 extracellular solute-binding protein [Bacillus paralicheniformis]MSO06456.1 extracellular solute-binding protein [Bacillus paralicheniformis]MSO10450.1 extracellular solute-binding protein [Bacillus paralicheniformis]NJE36470.1 sugar ABC transporter substrate-binding protein [Bacillus paralicheniformis]